MKRLLIPVFFSPLFLFFFFSFSRLHFTSIYRLRRFLLLLVSMATISKRDFGELQFSRFGRGTMWYKVFAWQCFVSVSVINRSCQSDPFYRLRQYLNISSVNNRRDPCGVARSIESNLTLLHSGWLQKKLTLLGITDIWHVRTVLIKIQIYFLVGHGDQRANFYSTQMVQSQLTIRIVDRIKVRTNFNQQYYIKSEC